MNSAACEVTLFVPGLLGPQSAFAQLAETEIPDLNLLETLLSRAGCEQSEIIHPLHGLFQLMGISLEVNQDPPIAAVTAYADGLPGHSGWWLRADPVYLQADRHQAFLLASDELQLTDNEAGQLITTINNHFANDGWSINAPQPQRWYLQRDTASQITTTPLIDVMGRDIHSHLPQGEDGPYWHRVLNELQMLLYEHPVNQQREVEGRLPVNSIWFWGSGSMPTKVTSSWDKVVSDDFVVQSLAQHGDLDTESLENVKPDQLEGRILMVINDCYELVRAGDVFGWLNILEILQNNVLVPLKTLIGQKHCRALTLIPANGHAYYVTDKNLRCFWRRHKSLQSFLSI